MRRDIGSQRLTCVFDRNDIYPWPWIFADEVLTSEMGGLTHGKKASRILQEYVDGHLFHYVDVAEINEIIHIILQKLIRSQNFFYRTVININVRARELRSFCNKLSRHDLTRLNTRRLLLIIREYEKLIKKVRVWGWIPPLVDGLTEPFLSDACLLALRNDLPQISIEEINKIYSILITPKTFSEVQKSEIDKLDMVIRLGQKQLRVFKRSTDANPLHQMSTRAVRLIAAYLRKYAWVSYNYEGPKLTAPLLRQLLQGMTVMRAKRELALIHSNHAKTLQYVRTIRELNRVSARTRYMLRIAATFMALKEYRKAIYQQSYVRVDPLLEELAQRIGVTVRELKFISPHEFRFAVARPRLYRAIARKRAKYCVVLVRQGVGRYLHGVTGRRLADRYRTRPALHDKVGELRGQVAYPGVVRGKAKLVLTTRDIPKVAKGNILISSSTNPDLLPAMKLAAAFVTDMGGIVSHAAIVAREFHTPCIVGTKVATKVIADGDRLEVDANRGIVKIL